VASSRDNVTIGLIIILFLIATSWVPSIMVDIQFEEISSENDELQSSLP
jgi:hypothetical protein